jgi:hypothetical protein
MSNRAVWASIALAALASVGVSASEPNSNILSAEASVPFANHGGIHNWRPDGDRGLWLQDTRRNWYYAKLMGSCWGLDFAEAIAFDTRPMGTFDRFSAIVVPREGRRCVVQSLTPSAGPVKDKVSRQAELSSQKQKR